MKYNPHEYQTFATDFILEHPVSAILLDMGLGKSVITLTAIKALMHDSFEVSSVLVIAPLRVATQTWPDEIEKWEHPCDGKYILDGVRLIICQSNAPIDEIRIMYPGAEINPLGDWTGGTDVDTGAVNRKLGSDMADSVTGGGLHGKDLSKADVSVNIYAFLKAQYTGEPVKLCCAIGDDTVDGRPYSEIVDEAGRFIDSIGGFEKFAEWGLV